MRIIFIFLLACCSSLFAQPPITKMWDYRYGGADVDAPTVFCKTLDHDFLLCGISNSQISYEKTENCRGDYDYWIVKVDSNGIKQWDKRYGGAFVDRLIDVIALSDSGFLLGGYSNSDTSPDKFSHKIDNVQQLVYY